MSREIVANLRDKLNRRATRLQSAHFTVVHEGIAQFLGFVNSQPILHGILADLLARHPDSREKAKKFVEMAQLATQPPPPWCVDEASTVARAYHIAGQCAGDNGTLQSTLMCKYIPPGTSPEQRNKIFIGQFVQPIVDYLDEKLDDHRTIFALLLRYKKKCEWFSRERLSSLSQDRGERGLAAHLYEYLHDQGFEFHIEPSSASGEVDLVAAQTSDDPLVADAKIFNPKTGHGKRKIIEGLAQVYRYAVDYNESFGYLLIYKTGATELRFAVAEATQATPLVVCNGKTIFLLIVDVDPEKKPASKGGPLAPVEVNQEELIQAVREIEQNNSIHVADLS